MCDRVRVIASQPATLAAHDAIVGLGFEGTVLKRPRSTYRAGRHPSWVKHKARCSITGMLLGVHQERDGQWSAMCDIDGRRVRARAGPNTRQLVGHPVDLVYSRVDADGGLREVRVGPVSPR